MIECGETGFRHFCPCTPNGVDLITVDSAAHLHGWHNHAAGGTTSKCARCGSIHALVGRVDGRRALGSVRIGFVGRVHTSIVGMVFKEAA